MDSIKRSNAGSSGSSSSSSISISKKKPSTSAETNLATAASVAASATSSEPRSQSLAASGASPIAAATNGASKLVFGLSSRTNRSKHDEYAEQRIKKQQALGAGANQSIETRSRREIGHITMSSNQSSTPRGATAHDAATAAAASGSAKAKPDSESRAKRTATSSNSSGGEARTKSKQSTRTDLKSAGKSSSGSSSREMGKTSEQSAPMKVDKRTSTSTSVSTNNSSKSSTVRARSRSPDGRVRLADGGRRKSLEEDLSTMKIESSPAFKVNAIVVGGGESNEEQKEQQAQQPVAKARTQFNIMPPPQMSISTGKSGSVVGFAKARIYEKPAKPILPTNNLLHQPSPLDPMSSIPWSSPLDDYGRVPKSIASGLRPPKQVMVSKARKEWEVGEPFTKCRSRKRLAAQANKKLFPGTWSMTSVVATQQLHLQQALAQSTSAGRRSNIQETDPSVKVLTRGSVLERIQQYERVPAASSSGGNSPNSYSSLSLSSNEDDDVDDAALLSLSRSSSLSSDAASGQETLDSLSGKAKDDNLASVGSNRANYKSRISFIQNQQNQSFASTKPDQSSASKSSNAQQRRLSLKRRSSTIGSSHGSTSSLIPKFYHPNGKPNTYEIEVQKRQIVACFENFPERAAQLDGPNAKKHFHKIALACNFSEYFKVPLIVYLKHKMETCPHLFVTKNNNLTKERKTSTVSLDTNGTSIATLRRHSRSNSVVMNQSAKSLTKTASIDSAQVGDAEAKPDITLITCDQFLACWRDLISQSYDNAARFVHLLTFGQRNYLLPEDFVPLVQSVIDDHPGLKFLRAAPDFHMRYIQTVIARIYFCVNKSWTGKISLQELRKSNLLAVLQVLSQEEDINQITDYFSYEHFYVIYCKFWNLDQDHDLLISKEDLARHNDAAISSRIIERIFSNVVSKQIHKTGKMNYSDFVWFLIAEEDKKHPRSIEYWFRLMDLDGDGYISMYEMEYFYYEQQKRLELMNIEPLPFLDSACQILDLVNPREKNKISLADLKRTKMATIFFDTFINLEKYLEHESREFVSTRDAMQDGVVVSDWDRYAAEEYESLVVEETTV